MPTSTGLGVTVGKGYAGYSPGSPSPPGVERIQDVQFTTGDGWAGTGTVDTMAGTGTMTVAQTLIATFLVPLIVGETYTLDIGVTSGSIGGTSMNATLQGGQQPIAAGVPPTGPWVFVADAASGTLTLQTTDAGTLVLDSVSLIGP